MRQKCYKLNLFFRRPLVRFCLHLTDQNYRIKSFIYSTQPKRPIRYKLLRKTIWLGEIVGTDAKFHNGSLKYCIFKAGKTSETHYLRLALRHSLSMMGATALAGSDLLRGAFKRWQGENP